MTTMFWRPAHHKLIVQIADGITTLLSFALAYYLWLWSQQTLLTWLIGTKVTIDSTLIFITILSAGIWIAIFNYQGAYSYQRFTSLATEIKFIFKTVLLGTLLLIGVVFLLRPVQIPRTLIMFFALTNFLLLTLEKLLLFLVARIVRRRGHNRKTVLVVGTGDQTGRFVENIQKHFHWGLDIVGFLGSSPEQVGQVIFGKQILGTFDDIIPVLHAHALDEVIITVSTRRMGEIRNVLEVCEREGVRVRIISDFLGKIAKKIRADSIYGLPIISISYISDNRLPLAVKRCMDIVGATFGLIIFAPFFLIIAAAIKISSRGPVFYNWHVVGFNKKPFKSWKFRTMVVGADKMKAQLASLNEMEGPVFKITHDPRVTPLGRFLRKLSLDELPQLWSVLKGDMSLVGPRPAGPHELVLYESWQRRKLSIKPGLTCLWQVNGRNGIPSFDEWVRLDLEYIDNWSLGLDLKILLRTIPAVVLGRGAS